MGPNLHHHASTSNSQLSSIDIIKRRRKCSRLLFGEPDREELDKWLKETTERNTAEAQSKWNFDFQHGIPINGQSSSTDYEYERIDAETVPQFYHSGPAKRKLVHSQRSTFAINGNMNGQPSSPGKNLQRSISVPSVGAKSISKLCKKVIPQTTHHNPDGKHKQSVKSPKKHKKKSSSPTKSKAKTDKKFQHAISAKIF